MDKSTKMGYSEALAITMIFIGTKAFLGYPRTVIEQGYTAGWLIVLVGGLSSVVLWMVISRLLARFPGKSLMEIIDIVLGPGLGLIVKLVGFIYILLTTSLLLRQFSDAVILTALPHAPISSLAFLFVIPVWIATYLGIEAITRSAFISLPFILFGVLAVLLSIYPYWEYNKLFPVLGAGPGLVLLYGATNVSAFEEVIILAILVPFFSFGSDKLKQVGVISLLFVTFVFVLITLVFLMVLPYPVATENLAPFYQLSRTIYLGRYYQRVEAAFILFWTFTAFLRLAIGLIACTYVLQETLKLPYYRPLLPALIMLILSLALTPAGLMQTVELEKIRLTYSGLIAFGIPCAVFAVALLRRKGEYDAKDNK